MAKITVKELEALNDEDSGRTIRDDGGLVGKVKASKNNISVAFYYRFRWENKSRDYSCGSWPKHSLSEIRKTRDEARLLLTNNINPVDHKKATQIEQQQEIERKILEAKLRETENLTVEALFTQWLHDGVSRKDKNAELKRSFHKDVIPIIGSTPLREFSEDQLRSLLRKVKSRGVNRYVIRLHKDITQMLSWAEERKPWRPLLVDGNPAKLVDPKKIIDSEYVDQRDRVLSKDELKELASIFKKLEVNYELSKTGKTLMASRPIEKKTQLALWICLSTMCRIGELLKAKWEDVDLENRTWKIPHTNSKNKVEHYIFLSDFAFDKFQELHNITGGTHFLFPSRNDTTKPVNDKSISKLVGDRQIQFKNRKHLKNRVNDNSLVLSNGMNGDWTPHDLRRTGATMMQSLGVTIEMIDRCQNHVVFGSKSSRHYLHHEYSDEKREAWDTLGLELQSILSNI